MSAVSNAKKSIGNSGRTSGMSGNSKMGKTNRSSAGFMKGIVPPRVAEESNDSLDDMES